MWLRPLFAITQTLSVIWDSSQALYSPLEARESNTPALLQAQASLVGYKPSLHGESSLSFHAPSLLRAGRSQFFYGWHIVAVGFLAQVNCAFHTSSALS